MPADPEAGEPEDRRPVEIDPRHLPERLQEAPAGGDDQHEAGGDQRLAGDDHAQIFVGLLDEIAAHGDEDPDQRQRGKQSEQPGERPGGRRGPEDEAHADQGGGIKEAEADHPVIVAALGRAAIEHVKVP